PGAFEERRNRRQLARRDMRGRDGCAPRPFERRRENLTVRKRRHFLLSELGSNQRRARVEATYSPGRTSELLRSHTKRHERNTKFASFFVPTHTQKPLMSHMPLQHSTDVPQATPVGLQLAAACAGVGATIAVTTGSVTAAASPIFFNTSRRDTPASAAGRRSRSVRRRSRLRRSSASHTTSSVT